MEHYRLYKLINNSTVSKSVTRIDLSKWFIINDFDNGQYFANKDIRFETKMIRSDLCD